MKAELQYSRDDKVTRGSLFLSLFLVNKCIKVLDKMAVAPPGSKSEFQVGSGPSRLGPEAQTICGL